MYYGKTDIGFHPLFVAIIDLLDLLKYLLAPHWVRGFVDFVSLTVKKVFKRNCAIVQNACLKYCIRKTPLRLVIARYLLHPYALRFMDVVAPTRTSTKSSGGSSIPWSIIS